MSKVEWLRQRAIRMKREATWTDTPFTLLEDARQWAVTQGLDPSIILNGERLRYFQITKFPERTLVAQVWNGGPVRERDISQGEPGLPLHDPDASQLPGRDNLFASSWTYNDDERTFQDLKDYFRALYTEPEIFDVLMIRAPTGEEYLYHRDKEGHLRGRTVTNRRVRWYP